MVHSKYVYSAEYTVTFVLQTMNDFDEMVNAGDPAKLRARAKKIRSKSAAEVVLLKAQEAEIQKATFMQKHSERIAVSCCRLMWLAP